MVSVNDFIAGTIGMFTDKDWLWGLTNSVCHNPFFCNRAAIDKALYMLGINTNFLEFDMLFNPNTHSSNI